MKKIISVGLLLVSIGSTPAEASSQYRGFIKTQRILSERISKNTISLPQYLPGIRSGFGSIYELLGTYEGVSGVRVYKNGHPNSLNVLIWYVLLSSLAKDIGGNCIQKTSLDFNAVFEQKLHAICQWPNSTAKDEKALEDFWIALMGYDAPQEEYFAWRDFFLTSSYSSKSAAETISGMAEAIFLNPYFLLER